VSYGEESDDDVHEIGGEDVVEELGDEVIALGDHEVEDADDAEAAPPDDEVPETDDVAEEAAQEAVLPKTALDPWFAQLVHGHCPPGSSLFDRHTPPTTMPGRDG